MLDARPEMIHVWIDSRKGRGGATVVSPLCEPGKDVVDPPIPNIWIDIYCKKCERLLKEKHERFYR